eukprot:NODE_6246_length_590_cov_148.046211_g5836_i0.p2 GENE.NODE_6246_length_590_cov_148.046211_g5836_i0~~NODE_6246_length_590_cov_148.046211_g5836_i0.p2  ORF type:complete len:145 (+),score=17.76 NODE_6246_length_590_cov_148.046211_g5836_i0:76-510(+)
MSVLRIVMLAALALSACGYSFTNTLDTTAYTSRFGPTLTNGFQPRGSLVMTAAPQMIPFQNPAQIWTLGVAYVVAVGPDAAPAKVGSLVYVPTCTRTFNNYCLYDASDIVGQVSIASYGANRAQSGSSRFAKPMGKQFGSWGFN